LSECGAKLTQSQTNLRATMLQWISHLKEAQHFTTISIMHSGVKSHFTTEVKFPTLHFRFNYSGWPMSRQCWLQACIYVKIKKN